MHIPGGTAAPAKGQSPQIQIGGDGELYILVIAFLQGHIADLSRAPRVKTQFHLKKQNTYNEADIYDRIVHRP